MTGKGSDREVCHARKIRFNKWAQPSWPAAWLMRSGSPEPTLHLVVWKMEETTMKHSKQTDYALGFYLGLNSMLGLTIAACLWLSWSPF